jgi:cell division protein FtsZ
VTNPTGVATEQAPEPEDEGRPVALAPQPKVLAAPPRPIKKIVDPAVADEYDEPLSIAPPHFVAEPRHGRAGSWLSLFGRPRTEVPRPTLRPTGGAQPALHPSEEASEESDDLEIPSFLRRLAN